MKLSCANGCKRKTEPVMYPYCGYDIPIFKCPRCGTFRLSEIVKYLASLTTRDFKSYAEALNYALEVKK